MTFWNVFFGVFAGIIAGVGIHLGIELIRGCIARKKMVKNLKFEIDFNIGKIDSFLEELGRYRDKVTGDSLFNYFGYFNLSKVIITTMFQMFLNGSIYKYLKYEDIVKLQNFITDFSLSTEQYINNQIKWNKENIKTPGIKQLAITDIEFWDRKFKENKRALQEVKEKLK